MKSIFRNQNEEHIQRCAWRLVRAAEDRMGGGGRGAEKMIWAVKALEREFPELNGKAEDYVRAAFVNFRNETKALFA